jgi:hypothetical protein
MHLTDVSSRTTHVKKNDFSLILGVSYAVSFNLCFRKGLLIASVHFKVLHPIVYCQRSCVPFVNYVKGVQKSQV